ncbi:hypothetical protein F5Y12DRAFT_583743 [Xylaria sp. FL1777]|nr:hypothetical protein F5Y12DRAFT_583743 [Xylaria sp. FL1777]
MHLFLIYLPYTLATYVLPRVPSVTRLGTFSGIVHSKIPVQRPTYIHTYHLHTYLPHYLGVTHPLYQQRNGTLIKTSNSTNNRVGLSHYEAVSPSTFSPTSNPPRSARIGVSLSLSPSHSCSSRGIATHHRPRHSTWYPNTPPNHLNADPSHNHTITRRASQLRTASITSTSITKAVGRREREQQLVCVVIPLRLQR